MAESYPTTPPMDEILASIRKIITEDAPAAARLKTAEADPADEDVLVLGEAADADEDSRTEPAEPEPPRVAEAAEARAGDAGLLSAGTQQASQRALAILSGLAIDPQAGANTLDGLVREMLRPMLKEWLDLHLPEIVERVVTREVARLSGR